MWARAGVLVILVLIGQASAQSPPVPYARDYKTSLVKYAVVDRSDGMSRDLYASRGAIHALKRDPRLQVFPVGVLFALDVYSARLVGRDPKTRVPRFDVTPHGHLVRSKGERTLHLMRKIQPGFGSQNWAFAGFDPVTAEPLKLRDLGDRRVRSSDRRVHGRPVVTSPDGWSGATLGPGPRRSSTQAPKSCYGAMICAASPVRRRMCMPLPARSTM